MRPAGAINASANNMAAYSPFYLNRGAVGGKQVVPTADIDRMKVPKSSWAAKDEMKFGYGLSNYWTVHDRVVYHGHDGEVEGGQTNIRYMSDYGVGYFFSSRVDFACRLPVIKIVLFSRFISSFANPRSVLLAITARVPGRIRARGLRCS